MRKQWIPGPSLSPEGPGYEAKPCSVDLNLMLYLSIYHLNWGFQPVGGPQLHITRYITSKWSEGLVYAYAYMPYSTCAISNSVVTSEKLVRLNRRLLWCVLSRKMLLGIIFFFCPKDLIGKVHMTVVVWYMYQRGGKGLSLYGALLGSCRIHA